MPGTLSNTVNCDACCAALKAIARAAVLNRLTPTHTTRDRRKFGKAPTLANVIGGSRPRDAELQGAVRESARARQSLHQAARCGVEQEVRLVRRPDEDGQRGARLHTQGEARLGEVALERRGVSRH